MSTVQVSLQEVVAHFKKLEDPRSSINQKHPLVSVVVISLMAVLAGAVGPTSIADWAMYKKDFLLHALDLPNGIPRKDVFRRVLMLLKPAAFQACFTNWLDSLRKAAAMETEISQPILAVDGKTARRSHCREKGLGALHLVSVWASEYGLSLGQVACAEKSNEITAIPEVLRLVDINGAIITIDAMGTQKAIASEIIDGGADYVLALKGNQESLHDAVIEHIDTMVENDFEGIDFRQFSNTETAHGRTTTRCYFQFKAPNDLPNRDHWKGLKTIGIAVSDTERNGKSTIETRYYISSLPMGVKQFARAVRGHWGIENTCHWSLDVTFREDESRIRERNIRDNFAWMRRFVLSLLKQHPGKGSLIGKRRASGWSDAFLMQILTGTTV